MTLYKPDDSFLFDEIRWVKQFRKCVKVIQFMEKSRTSPQTAKFAPEPLVTLSQQLKQVFVS